MAHFSSNVARAGEILLVLGEAGPDGLSLQEISRNLAEAKPAVHRALGALALKGFVEPTGRHGYYRLGPAIYGLARRQARADVLATRMRPALIDIVARIGQPVFLMARAGHDAICLEMLAPTPAQTLTGGTGGRVPLGVAAGSLALLSSMPNEAALQVIEANAERYRNYPSLRPLSAELMRELVQEARARGYALDFGYYFPNGGGIGIAVETGLPGGAELSISVSIYGEMHTPEKLDALAQDIRLTIARHASDPR